MNRAKTWYFKNRRRVLRRAHKYYRAHKAERRAYAKKWFEANKEKMLELNRAWRKANKKRCSRNHKYSLIRRKYGLDKQAYWALKRSNNFKCYNPFCSTKKNLRVDHDHKTGKVRGMLCIGCNTALGSLKENIKTIVGLKAYIQKYG